MFWRFEHRGIYRQYRRRICRSFGKSFFYEDEVVVEEYIKGREFACGVIDNEALPPIEIIPKTGFFDYANKYQADATLEVCPADIPEETASRMMELTVKHSVR